MLVLGVMDRFRGSLKLAQNNLKISPKWVKTRLANLYYVRYQCAVTYKRHARVIDQQGELVARSGVHSWNGMIAGAQCPSQG